MGGWEAACYKLNIDHTGSLMFMEKLFSVMTLQIYLRENGRNLLRHEKIFTILRYISEL